MYAAVAVLPVVSEEVRPCCSFVQSVWRILPLQLTLDFLELTRFGLFASFHAAAGEEWSSGVDV